MDERYIEDGYLFKEGFFAKDEIDRIRDDAKGVFAAQMVRLGILGPEDASEDEFERGMFELFEKHLGTFANCGKQSQHLISLHRLSLDQRITEVLTGELGLEFPNVSTRPVMMFNHPRLAKKEVYWRLSAHQDWRSMQGSLDSTVVWIPLVDVDVPLGALEIVPGSHRWGLLDAELRDGYGQLTGEVDERKMVPVEAHRGDALFFSAFLMHRSGTNVTEHVRWSCHFRYNNLREPTFVDRGFPHPYVYHPQEELITQDFPARRQVEETFVRAR